MEGTNLDCEQFKCCKLPHIKVWSQTKYARSHVSPTLISVRDLLQCVTQLVDSIQYVMKNATPTKCPSRHSKRWWTRRLTVLRRQSNKLRNKYRRTRQEQDRRVWRRKANEYTKEIALSRSRYFVYIYCHIVSV